MRYGRWFVYNLYARQSTNNINRVNCKSDVRICCEVANSGESVHIPNDSTFHVLPTALRDSDGIVDAAECWVEQ